LNVPKPAVIKKVPPSRREIPDPECDQRAGSRERHFDIRPILTDALSLKPVRKIGAAGYSFYLWHWLVMYALMRYLHPGCELFAFTAMVTAILAGFTFLVVEKPFIWHGRRITIASSADRQQSNRFRAGM
jgi:peptidoglycan/LPS O-acetylase OafA/YrhL